MKSLYLAAAALTVGACSGQTDEPDYKVIQQAEEIEIRQYEPTAIAYTTVSGERDEAINKGFRSLFKYIDGENVAEESIAMTAPVAQEKQSQKIPMTAPVAQQLTGEDQWQVQFYMPDDRDFASLPKPTNSDVMLKSIPEQKKAVIRFSGTMSSENLTENENKLRDYLNENNMKFNEPALYAGYNPPWTPWFMRRNEVMFSLK